MWKTKSIKKPTKASFILKSALNLIHSNGYQKIILHFYISSYGWPITSKSYKLGLNVPLS